MTTEGHLVMSTTPTPPPDATTAHDSDSAQRTPGQTLSLSQLLRRAVIGTRGQKLGQLSDVIVRLRGTDYPLVTGLVADLGGRRVFLPADIVTERNTDQVLLSTAKVDLREFERRDGEVLLRADILGHRLIDIPRARLVRAYDLELTRTPQGWVLAGVDTSPASRWRRVLGIARPAHDQHDGEDGVQGSGCRDWKAFEGLIGHQPTVLLRTRVGRLRRLKPPQIADLLEEASREEQTELLQQVHADPELEADVFEELDDDRQSRLLRDRPDPEIAAVLARMRADDAADAIADLPQDRRKPVLELLPAGQRTKVTALLSYNPTSGGGLMGLDFLALPRNTTAAAALERVRTSRTLQPEALTTVFSLNDHGKLRGATSLVALIQAEPGTRLREVTEPDPVRVHPDADLIDITVLMTDYNLLNLPVVDEDDHLIGVITVDDVLESSIPRNWRRREPAPHPDTADDPIDTETEQAPPDHTSPPTGDGVAPRHHRHPPGPSSSADTTR
jgi:CBS domain-containing protein